MPKSTTPKYLIKANYISFAEKKYKTATMIWVVHSGRPTLENLKTWRESMNKSITDPNGCNQHLNATQSPYSNVWIQENKPLGKVIVKYRPPSFELI